MEKPRVFISCGQREKNTRELQLAEKIKELLQRDFEPFLAKRVQTLGGLTDEIYRNLEVAEYFLFVDFKREPLRERESYRGSLFSHQELAIASFLKKECLIFSEQGVELEGIQSFILSNPAVFSTDEQLLNAIEAEVKRKWQTDWRNELKLLLPSPRFEDAHLNGVRPSRWYHVEVRNRHRTKHAVGCFAFLHQIPCGPSRLLRNAPLAWAGTPNESVVILPGDARKIDAFFHFREWDPRLHFHAPTTSGHYMPVPVEQAGTFDFLGKGIQRP